MSPPLSLLEPIRFPGDDYVLRMNATQVAYLVALLHGIRQNNPDLFVDPNVAMMELQLLYQAQIDNAIHGDEGQQQKAAERLPAIRDGMVAIRKVMETQP